MLKKVDINFLINSIRYFSDYRRKNLEVFNNFYLRLDDFFDNSKQDQKLIKNSTLLLTKLVSPIFLVLRQVFRLPHYIIQTISLRRSQCEYIKSCEAFSIASSRQVLDENESLGSQIESMTEALGGADVLNLFSKYEQFEKTVIVFDTQIESSLWSYRGKLHNERLFIFDGAYLIFLSFGLLVNGLIFRGAEEFKFLKCYLNLSKASKDWQVRPVYIRIIEALTFISYDNLINKFPKHSTTFLTSNSFFVELLRAYILQNEQSGKITELLHGAIADPTEVWLKRLLTIQSSSKEKKHLLIPNVPNLPELDILNNKYFLGNNASINTYLNSSLHKIKIDYGSYKSYALKSLEQLNFDPNDKVLTLTIFGGTSIRGEYFISSGFKVEAKILDKVNIYFSNKKIDINIIYVPHPRNKHLPPNVTDMFNKLSVQILDVSTFTYFITDYCVSNLSSCLFELNWIGAECFSPIILGDGIYSQNYLETIHHPKTNGIEALENALYSCLEAGISGSYKSYIEKFDMRLKMVKGDNLN